jgi:membrane protein implicated in regulation of membrane protease activity
MAFADNLPINESLGVFVGVAGIDWLTDGQAEPIKAVAIAIVAGAAILITRRWLKRRNKD